MGNQIQGKVRAWVTPLTVFVFLLLAGSGFLMDSGQRALHNFHEIFAFVFCSVAVLHIVLNWRPLLNCLKTKKALVALVTVCVLTVPVWISAIDNGGTVLSSRLRNGHGGKVLSLASARTENERKVLGVLNEMTEKGTRFLSVEEETGRVLRLLTETTGATRVVEIGTSTGYSGLWFGMALQTTGGHLTTFEIDPGRARTARDNFKRAGIDPFVTVVEGDAHKKIAELTGPIDIVFLDADKEGYPDYLAKLLPLLRPGGLIVADNLTMAPAYSEVISRDPALETVYIGSRVSISLKKR